MVKLYLMRLMPPSILVKIVRYAWGSFTFTVMCNYLHWSLSDSEVVVAFGTAG